ncbi:hypothetical protein [Pseudonocardia sp.]|uniref:hypothetical protein n=1 Tax=Pseudonocardia sp. TaxID=60912 RepID=UPI003D1145DB
MTGVAQDLPGAVRRAPVRGDDRPVRGGDMDQVRAEPMTDADLDAPQTGRH